MFLSFAHRSKFALVRKVVSSIMTFAFLTSLSAPAGAQLASLLPTPGSAVTISPVFVPPTLKGLNIHPENPFLFDFIVGRGDDKIEGTALKAESEKLVKFFLTAMTIPDKEAWVNLSPYEANRIIPDALGKTEMGKVMLEQDYLLKQLASSLTNPDTDLGKKFWTDVRAKAKEKFGTTDIPMSTFNKVWIVPSKAEVAEKDGKVFITRNSLKVMLEEDYEAMSNQKDIAESRAPARDQAPSKTAVIANEVSPRGTNEVKQSLTNEIASSPVAPRNDVLKISSEVFRSTILPTIEKEINEGKNFAAVRQIYDAAILAVWYKSALKESLLGKIYADKSKVKGIETDAVGFKEEVYKKYVEAFKKGAYNIIKEDFDMSKDESTPRRYFSGGMSTAYPDGVAVSSGVTEVVVKSDDVLVRVLNAEEKPEADVLAKGVAQSAAVAGSTVVAFDEIESLSSQLSWIFARKGINPDVDKKQALSFGENTSEVSDLGSWEKEFVFTFADLVRELKKNRKNDTDTLDIALKMTPMLFYFKEKVKEFEFRLNSNEKDRNEASNLLRNAVVEGTNIAPAIVELLLLFHENSRLFNDGSSVASIVTVALDKSVDARKKLRTLIEQNWRVKTVRTKEGKPVEAFMTGSLTSWQKPAFVKSNSDERSAIIKHFNEGKLDASAAFDRLVEQEISDAMDLIATQEWQNFSNKSQYVDVMKIEVGRILRAYLRLEPQATSEEVVRAMVDSISIYSDSLPFPEIGNTLGLLRRAQKEGKNSDYDRMVSQIVQSYAMAVGAGVVAYPSASSAVEDNLDKYVMDLLAKNLSYEQMYKAFESRYNTNRRLLQDVANNFLLTKDEKTGAPLAVDYKQAYQMALAQIPETDKLFLLFFEDVNKRVNTLKAEGQSEEQAINVVLEKEVQRIQNIQKIEQERLAQIAQRKQQLREEISQLLASIIQGLSTEVQNATASLSAAANQSQRDAAIRSEIQKQYDVLKAGVEKRVKQINFGKDLATMHILPGQALRRAISELSLQDQILYQLFPEVQKQMENMTRSNPSANDKFDRALKAATEGTIQKTIAASSALTQEQIEEFRLQAEAKLRNDLGFRLDQNPSMEDVVDRYREIAEGKSYPGSEQDSREAAVDIRMSEGLSDNDIYDSLVDRRIPEVMRVAGIKDSTFQEIEDILSAGKTALENGFGLDLIDPTQAGEQESSSPLKPVGGINFDPTLMNLQVKRDKNGVPLPVFQQDLPNINIEGLYPVIINIAPATMANFPLLSKAEEQKQRIPSVKDDLSPIDRQKALKDRVGKKV